MIAVYKEDLPFNKGAYYIYNEETHRFQLNLNPLFSFTYKEVVENTDFIVWGRKPMNNREVCVTR